MTLEIALSKDRDRPARNKAASEVSSDSATSLTRLELVIDLNHVGDWCFEIDRADRHALDQLPSVTADTTVKIVVADRIYPTGDAINMLVWCRSRGVEIVIMASTLEAGLSWQRAITRESSAA